MADVNHPDQWKRGLNVIVHWTKTRPFFLRQILAMEHTPPGFPQKISTTI
jgi:hypothetical protein